MRINKGYLIVVFLLPGLVNAASKNMTVGVSASETYNNNIGLAADGVSKLDDFIFQLNPYVSYRRNSRRVKMNLDYRMQSVFYADYNQNDKVFHQFSGNLDAKVYKDILFVKGSGQYGQSIIDPTKILALDNLSVSGNRTNFASANVNPYGVFKLGRFAKTTVGVDRAAVRYKASTLGDSDRTNYYVNVNSGPDFNKIKWDVNYKYDKSRFDTQPDVILKRYDLGLGYALSRRITLSATAGRENNTYLRAASTEIPDATFWDAGIIWNPSTRTSAELRFGDRFYGTTGFFKLTNKTRKTEISVNYQEDVTSSSITEFDRQVFTTTDPFGNSVSPVSGEPNAIDISIPAATAETFIRKRLDINFLFKTAKSKWSIGGFRTQRIYQTTDNKENLYGVNGKFDWNFALRTRLILDANGQIQEFRGSSRKDGVANVGLTIHRQMRRQLAGALSVQHTRQDSTINTSDYSQNQFTISIDWKF